MAKTTYINVRTEPKLKSDVENILKNLGMTHADAINIFYSQIKLNNGLPFEVKIPECKLEHRINKTTEKVINDLKNNVDTEIYDNTQDLFNELGI